MVRTARAGTARADVRAPVLHGTLGVMFLGKDLIVWLLLALGGALFVGNVMALVRPPVSPRGETDLAQAPRSRSIAMAAIGLVVAIAALAALVSR